MQTQAHTPPTDSDLVTYVLGDEFVALLTQDTPQLRARATGDDFEGRSWGEISIQYLGGSATITEFVSCYRVDIVDALNGTQTYAVTPRGDDITSGALDLARAVALLAVCGVECEAGAIEAGKTTAADVCETQVEPCDIIREFGSRDEIGQWYEIPHCAHGDYAGTSVERANYRYFRELLDGLDPDALWHAVITGGHGYHDLWVRGEFAASGVIETIERLARYQIADEDLCSEVEHDLYCEALDFYLAHDFGREIIGATAAVLSTDAITKLVGIAEAHAIDELFRLRESAHEETGSLWYFRPRFDRDSVRRLIEWAMVGRKTITLPADGWDAQIRRRAGKISVFSRVHWRRDWRPFADSLDCF